MHLQLCVVGFLASHLAAGAVPALVEVSSKVVITSDDLELGADRMSNEAYQAMLNRLAHAGGALVALRRLPAVVTEQGKPGRVEFARRKGDLNPAGAENPAQPFVGWIVRYETARAGRQVGITARVRYGFVPGEDPPASLPPAKGVLWDAVVAKDGASGARLGANEVLVTRLGEVEPGRHAYCFTSVTPTNPNGEKYDDFAAEYPDPDAGPPVAGRYRVHATVVEGLEVPLLADSPLDPPRLYGFHDAGAVLEALERWKLDPDLRVRDLAPVNLPAGKMREAWGVFPGFRVAFQPSGQPGTLKLSYELPRPPLADGVVVAPLPPQHRHAITVEGQHHLTFLLAGEDQEKPPRLILSVDRIE